MDLLKIFSVSHPSSCHFSHLSSTGNFLRLVIFHKFFIKLQKPRKIFTPERGVSFWLTMAAVRLPVTYSYRTDYDRYVNDFLVGYRFLSAWTLLLLSFTWALSAELLLQVYLPALLFELTWRAVLRCILLKLLIWNC